MKATLSVLLFLATGFRLQAQVPLLNSYPSAAATIFLDFDGEYVQGTSWNWAGPIDAQPSGLSAAAINEIFERVAEDYRIFNINITTDSTVYSSAPVFQRMRIIITPTYSWYGMAGGVSYVGSFTWGDDTPAWVFSGLLGNSPKKIAESASHEAGHTLGLQHQSTYDGACNKLAEYNSGKGSGEISWAPIMGVGYSRNITTWFNGPNTFACNYIQNDIAIIAGSPNNFGMRTDEYGNTMATAMPLTIFGNSFQASGVINDSTDRDVFQFSVPSTTTLQMSAVPDNVGTGNSGADIDIKVSLLDNLGDTIGQYNPSDLLDAGVDSNLNAGTYYLVIDGVANTNLVKYGSLGHYVLSGSLLAALPLHEARLTGSVLGSRHQLEWQVNADEALRSVELEYSSTGKHFSYLASGNAAGSYEWVPPPSAKNFYRLKIESSDGAIAYSRILELKDATGESTRLLSNLVRNRAQIQSSCPGQYELWDATGRLLMRKNLQTGLNEIDLGPLPHGMLLLRWRTSAGIHTEKLIKQ